MSVKSEESDQAFRKWKEEIERRCEEHIRKNSEYKPLKKGVKSKSNLVVQVEEATTKGCWLVRANGKVVFVISGPLAHQHATKFANNYLNKHSGDPKVSSGAPEMCVFCGGRYAHREGCPDLKQRGPKILPPMPGMAPPWDRMTDPEDEGFDQEPQV